MATSFLTQLGNGNSFLSSAELANRAHQHTEFGSFLKPTNAGKNFDETRQERPGLSFFSDDNHDFMSSQPTSQHPPSFLIENEEQRFEHDIDNSHSSPMASATGKAEYIPPHRRGKHKSKPSVPDFARSLAMLPHTVPKDVVAPATNREEAKSPPPLANGWAEEPFPQDASTEWPINNAAPADTPVRANGIHTNRKSTSRRSGSNDGPTEVPTPRSTRGSARGGNRGRGRRRGFEPAEPHVDQLAPNNNTRAHGWPKSSAIPKGRNDPWAGKKDIPKLNPNRQKVNWDSGSGSTHSNSDSTSCGWGPRKKRTDDQSPALADFSGGWAPAPVDWDSRPGFRDGQSARRIEEWLDHSVQELGMVENPSVMPTIGNFSFNAPGAEVRDLSHCLQGEAAPRYWVPQTIESKTAKCFWNDYLRSTETEPIDENDLVGVQPWWQTYQANGCSFLAHRVHPHVTGPDPTETEDERLKRENDRGSNSVREDRRAYEQARKTAHLQRQAKKQQLAKQHAKAYALDRRPDKIRAGIHVVLRSATIEDAKALRDIYNAYVDHTVIVQEIDRVNEQEMTSRIRKSQASKLPFIVAFQRGEKIKGRNKNYNNGEDLYTPDKIIGFAYANDYFDAKGVWRFTATLEIYVISNLCNKGIGSCLLDKMMGLLDITYVERRGYETVGDELDGAGVSRNLVNVLVQYLYDAQQPDRMEWVSKWLQRKAGFERTAELKGVAHKFDKMLNFAILQRTSGASFDPTNPHATI